MLREESSLYDDIKHRFQIDERNLIGIKKAVDYSLEYEKLLDVNTITFLHSINQALVNGEKECISNLMSDFKLLLDKMIYSKSNVPISTLETSIKEKLMLVEDNIDILTKLQSDFSHYFDVNSFTDGKAALEELTRKSNEYDVIIADLELLDNQNSWQHTTGYDILEIAEKYPHIALYGLTSMPKRAVSELQENLSTRRAKIKYKHPSEYLPLGYSLEAFVEVIKDEIRELSNNKRGPKLGSWKKGLLSTYYETKSNLVEWEELVNEIYDRVANLLVCKNNIDNIVPKKLFSEKKTHFDKTDLSKIIAHRLLCIYYQLRDEEFRSEEFKLLVEHDYGQVKNYLTTMLGFSITRLYNYQVKDETTVFDINISEVELLDEEIIWINKRKDSDPELISVDKFPQLLSILKELQPFINVTALRTATFKRISDFILFFTNFLEAEVEIDSDTILKNKIRSSFLWYKAQQEYDDIIKLPNTQNIRDVVENYS